jgi:hypothetical protein
MQEIFCLWTLNNQQSIINIIHSKMGKYDDIFIISLNIDFKPELMYIGVLISSITSPYGSTIKELQDIKVQIAVENNITKYILKMTILIRFVIIFCGVIRLSNMTTS